jgi:chemotaxis protein MotA
LGGMSSIIGLVVVFGSIALGFGLSGGPFPVLWQPYELIVIGGAALGTVIIGAPGALGKRVVHALKLSFSGKPPGKADYLDLLVLMNSLFQTMRREGILAMENHISDPAQSPLFKRHPGVVARHHAIQFLTESIKQLVDGCSPEDLHMMMDTDLEQLHAEEAQAIGQLRTVGDALPGLGIVAAVLGIVITMAHLDGGPEEIGHHVAAALVGTFLGILLCYGVVQPLASSVEVQVGAEGRYLMCIKDGVIAAGRGANPASALEFARRAIFPDERPSLAELEQAISKAKEGA